MKPRGSKFVILYSLCKVQKGLIHHCSPLRPILSAIKTSSSNIAKQILPILKPITTNKFTIKNSFELAKEVIEQDSGLLMASLDVELLSTNISITGGDCKYCFDALFANKPKINNFSRNNFDKLLRMALQNNFFNLAVKLLNKLGVAIG